MATVLLRGGGKFLLTAAAIFFIGSLPYLIFNMKAQVTVWKLLMDGSLANASFLSDHLHFNVSSYFSHVGSTFLQLFHWKDLYYYNFYIEKVPLFPEFFDSYLESMVTLFSAILLGLVTGIIVTLVVMLLPVRVRKPFHSLLFVLESLPDIFIVVFFQWTIFYIHEKTGVELLDTYSLFDDAYVLPIICLSFLPAFYIGKYLLKTFEEEEDRLYVELARGKGMGRLRILLVHISRNALVTFFAHFKTIFWLGLSNLIALDVLFMNDDGFMVFMVENAPLNPTIFTVGLWMVFVPFYIVMIGGEALIYSITRSGGTR
ncbi:MAG TPA: ABC transporter permease subunit [Bacillales bacterium]|nr:ABC transporter permease subunit [Bacillales bacterium]